MAKLNILSCFVKQDYSFNSHSTEIDSVSKTAGMFLAFHPMHLLDYSLLEHESTHQMLCVWGSGARKAKPEKFGR